MQIQVSLEHKEIAKKKDENRFELMSDECRSFSSGTVGYVQKQTAKINEIEANGALAPR